MIEAILAVLLSLSSLSHVAEYLESSNASDLLPRENQIRENHSVEGGRHSLRRIALCGVGAMNVEKEVQLLLSDLDQRISWDEMPLCLVFDVRRDDTGRGFTEVRFDPFDFFGNDYWNGLLSHFKIDDHANVLGGGLSDILKKTENKESVLGWTLKRPRNCDPCPSGQSGDLISFFCVRNRLDCGVGTSLCLGQCGRSVSGSVGRFLPGFNKLLFRNAVGFSGLPQGDQYQYYADKRQQRTSHADVVAPLSGLRCLFSGKSGAPLSTKIGAIVIVCLITAIIVFIGAWQIGLGHSRNAGLIGWSLLIAACANWGMFFWWTSPC